MSDAASAEKKKAFEIPCGNAVIITGDAGVLVCMKAERAGKEYTHHYAVQLHPTPTQETALIYLDPEEEIIDCATTLSFTVSQAAECTPDVGEVFRNFQGTFLKVHEDPKSQKMYAYLNLETGQVQRRQERQLEAVYKQWDADGVLDRVSLINLYQRHSAR